MPYLIDASSLPVRVRAQRMRSRIGRQLEFVGRCEALQNAEIDDETFSELLSEAVEELGLRKEKVSEALEFNLASIYRWLSRKSMPMLFVRPLLLMKIASLVRNEIDDAVGHIIDDRRTRQPVTANNLAPEVACFLSPPPLRTFVADVPAELIALVGPFGRSEQDRRPTFAAFAWRGVGEFELMPDSAVTEAWVYFSTPGVSYYVHDKKRFVPVEVQDGVGRLLLFAASERKAGALPSIRLRSPEGALASGFLVLASADGVPYDVAEGEHGQARAVIHPLRVDTSITLPVSLAIALPVAPGIVHATANLVEIPASKIDSRHERFDHLKSLKLGNFDLYQDRRHQRLLAKLRDGAENNKEAELALDRSGVSPRIIIFDEKTERFSSHATYICRHQGGELVIPLYGAVNAHLFDRQAEFSNFHEVAHENEFQLSQAIAETDVYEPFMLLGPNDNVAGIPGVVAFNPDRLFHGFTALSRCAGFLALTVRNTGMSDRWVARSVIGQPHRRLEAGAR